MLTHVVLMRLHPEASETDVDDLARRLRNLAALLAGPASCTIGPNVTAEPFAQGFEFGFVIRFPDRHALATYHDHPDHRPIGDLVRRLSSSFLVFDFDG
jgi:hypothetical protein